MKQLLTTLALVIATSMVGQSYYNGFNDGFQSTCDDALVVLATPSAPTVICSGSNDYSCGYREGVKAATKAIARRKTRSSYPNVNAPITTGDKSISQRMSEPLRNASAGKNTNPQNENKPISKKAFWAWFGGITLILIGLPLYLGLTV